MPTHRAPKGRRGLSILNEDTGDGSRKLMPLSDETMRSR